MDKEARNQASAASGPRFLCLWPQIFHPREHSGAATSCAFSVMWKKGEKGGNRKLSNEKPVKPVRKVNRLPAMGNPDHKRRGEAAEAEFIARASGFDFRVAKPWGESDPYDVLVGSGHAFWRVQVKCATACRLGQYVVRGGGENYNYTKDDIDFLAA